MKEIKANKHNRVILSTLGIFTFIIMICGASFSYLSIENKRGIETALTHISKKSPLKYNNIGDLTLSDAIPGDTVDLTFTVENPSIYDGKRNTSNSSYDLDFVIILNEFASVDKSNQLYMTVKEKTNGTSKLNIVNDVSSDKKTYVISGDEKKINIVNDQTILSGETHTFVATITYPETSENIDQKNSFSGYFEVNDVRNEDLK